MTYCTDHHAEPPAGRFSGKSVGASAIALAVSIVVQNVVVIVAKAPSYSDPVDQVFAFHAANRAAVSISVGLEALNVPLLLGFLTGLHGLVQRRRGGGADWSRLAVAAGATLCGIYALYAALWIGVVLFAGQLTEPSPIFELIWQLHAAAFALALPALGTTFLGAAFAAHTGRLTSSWQRLIGIAGGGLLIAAGTANLAIADGSPLLLVGMLGFAAWPVWLLATGLRLIRGSAIAAA